MGGGGDSRARTVDRYINNWPWDLANFVIWVEQP